MKFKGEKRYITVTKENVNKYIEYIIVARNSYANEGEPIEDVNNLLLRFMKLKKKLRA